MNFNHFPTALGKIIAANLIVVVMAAAVFVIMMVTGAVAGDVEPIGTEVASIVELPAIDTQVSSVVLVRTP